MVLTRLVKVLFPFALTNLKGFAMLPEAIHFFHFANNIERSRSLKNYRLF